MKACTRFFRDIRGNFATIVAIIAPVLLGTAGLATDYAQYYRYSEKLQEVTDTAALAGTQELMLAGTSDDQIEAVVKSYVEANLLNDTLDSSVQIQTTIDRKNNDVKVDVSYVWYPMFAQYIYKKTTPIKTSATARLAGEGLTCVIGLMPPQKYAKSSIHLEHNSKLDAHNCGVYSNSDHSAGMRIDGAASIKAESICSAGGYLNFGSNGSFDPEPLVDCPKIDDPLRSRMIPMIGSCDATNLVIDKDTTLKSGTYCGGLAIRSNATVKLEKGIFIIKDGPLIVTDKASLIGKEASFLLTGDKSIFEFHADTTIDLSAMKTGKLAGLLMFEDHKVPYSFDFNPFFMAKLPENVRLHKIASNNARNLLGTLYLKNSVLLINSKAPVADQSAYTAIVTGRLWLQEGPTLYLNADYTTTTVPVPSGLIGKKPVLVN